MDVKEKVLEVLNNSAEPLKGGQIAEISGLDKKDVDKAIKALKSEERSYLQRDVSMQLTNRN